VPRQINVATFSDVARAVLGMQGGAAALPEVLDELRATLVLENDRIEWGFAASAPIVGSNLNVPAGGVGIFGAVGIRSPVDGGALAVPKAICFAGSQVANRDVILFINPRSATKSYAVGANSAPAVLESRFEDRAGFVPATRIITATLANLGFGNEVIRLVTITTGQTLIPLPQEFAVLGPGADLLCVNSVANEALRVGWLWRERPLFKGIRG